MKKPKQNWIKKLGAVVITVFLTCILLANHSFADVGSFQSYHSGGRSHSSSSSSRRSSSSSRSYSGNSRSSSDDGIGGVIGVVIFFIILAIVLSQAKKKGGVQPVQQNYTPTQTVAGMNEADVLAKVKAIDPDFNKEEFIAWSKTLFIKLQQAWTACDWEVIRTFETKELFEQHKAQLQGYIDNHTVNVMDRICVHYARLYHFKQEGGQDVLIVELNSRMNDYIMDKNTGKVLQGDKTTEYTNTYLLTFVRTTGVKTTKATGEVDTTNCPNCGAPTKITSSGKCEYCGSVITTDTHDWALASLQRK